MYYVDFNVIIVGYATYCNGVEEDLSQRLRLLTTMSLTGERERKREREREREGGREKGERERKRGERGRERERERERGEMNTLCIHNVCTECQTVQAAFRKGWLTSRKLAGVQKSSRQSCSSNKKGSSRVSKDTQFTTGNKIHTHTSTSTMSCTYMYKYMYRVLPRKILRHSGWAWFGWSLCPHQSV